MSAAHQALRTARSIGRELAVTVLDRGTHTSYSACGIPYWMAGDVDSGDDLVARTADEHRAGRHRPAAGDRGRRRGPRRAHRHDGRAAR